MTEPSGIQVVGVGDEDGGASERPVGAGRAMRWAGWAVLVASAGVLLVLGGGEDSEVSPDTTRFAPLTVEVPPEVESPPVRITRGGFVGPALKFEEVGRVTGLERVVPASAGVLGLRVDADGRHTIVRSTDGISWTALPELPARVRPMDVAEWSGKPVILGIDVDPALPMDAPEPYGDPGLWQLANGAWERYAIPVPPIGRGIMWQPSQLATLGETVVVVGYRQPDQRRRIVRALPTEIARLMTSETFWMEYHDGTPMVSVAFLGTPVWSATPLELGLEDSELIEPQVGYGTSVLVSDDLLNWNSSDLSNVFVHRLHDVGGDRIGAQVWGQNQEFWVSSDGLRWESESDIPGAVQLMHWLGDGPVAAMGSVISRSNGEAWRPISPRDAIPGSSTRDWQFAFVEVFDDRLVAGAQGTLWNEGREPPPVQLASRDGSRVEVDLFNGTITTLDEQRWTWTLWSGRTGLMELNPNEGTLDLMRDGQAVASLAIDDVASLGFPYPSLDVQLRVLVTSDERRWHMGTFSIAGAAGFSEPAAFSVGEQLVVLVGVSDPASGEAGASVWTASLP